MLYGPMTHPQFLRALAAAGHGSKILLADANYPHTSGVSQRCELVSLNLAPGLLDVLQVLEVLKHTIPIERAEIMTPAADAEPVAVVVALDRQETVDGGDTALARLAQSEQLTTAAVVTLDDLLQYIGDDTTLAAHLPAMQAYRARYGAGR